MKKNLVVFITSTLFYVISYGQPGGGAGTGADRSVSIGDLGKRKQSKVENVTTLSRVDIQPFSLGTNYRGAIIKFHKIDNVVKIYKRFQGGPEQLVYTSPHIDDNPDLDPERYKHVLINPSDPQGTYTFRIEVLNEQDKGHHNPWGASAAVYEIGETYQVKPELNPRTFSVFSNNGSEHGKTADVQVLTITKRF